MRGLLADANIAGHQRRIVSLLDRAGLLVILTELGVEFALLSDIGLPYDVDDHTLWHCCQSDGWVLFTDNRNDDGPTSLQATLDNDWMRGKLPIITLADKQQFDRSATFRERVAVLHLLELELSPAGVSIDPCGGHFNEPD